MRTNRRFQMSLMKSSVACIRIRLQRRKNLNTSRENWRKFATHDYQAVPECWHNAWGFLGGRAPLSHGASSGPITDTPHQKRNIPKYYFQSQHIDQNNVQLLGKAGYFSCQNLRSSFKREMNGRATGELSQWSRTWLLSPKIQVRVPLPASVSSQLPKTPASRDTLLVLKAIILTGT